jgi:hypothetical protein
VREGSREWPALSCARDLQERPLRVDGRRHRCLLPEAS